MSFQIDDDTHYKGKWFSFVAGPEALNRSMKYKDIAGGKGIYSFSLVLLLDSFIITTYHLV